MDLWFYSFVGSCCFITWCCGNCGVVCNCSFLCCVWVTALVWCLLLSDCVCFVGFTWFVLMGFRFWWVLIVLYWLLRCLWFPNLLLLGIYWLVYLLLNVFACLRWVCWFMFVCCIWHFCLFVGYCCTLLLFGFVMWDCFTWVCLPV